VLKENVKEDDIDITNWQYFEDFEEYVDDNEEDNKPYVNNAKNHRSSAQSRNKEDKFSRKRDSMFI